MNTYKILITASVIAGVVLLIFIISLGLSIRNPPETPINNDITTLEKPPYPAIIYRKKTIKITL
jgi:ABC-type antimicrobial peptide transport system permease subunit